MQLPTVIGLPPMDNADIPAFITAPDCKKNLNFTPCVFPRLRIYPATPKFENGLELFSLDTNEGWTKFTEFLTINGGFTPGLGWNNFIDLSYQNISPFSESYGNDFSQSSLVTAMSSPLSAGGREMAWVAQGSLGDIAKALKTNSTTGPIVAAATKAGEAMKAQSNNLIGKQRTNTLISLGKELATGGKLNFPMIWKSTSFDRSYDITVRLYNMFPGDDDAHDKWIIGPMVALLAMVVPTSEDGNTYKWPLIAKFQAPGQFQIDAGYIKSMSVVKGGDANDQAWNNRPGIVDIKLSIGDLYNTMVSSELASHAPTVARMVETMRTEHSTTCCTTAAGGAARVNSAIPNIRTRSGQRPNRTAETANRALNDVLNGIAEPYF